VGRHCTKELRIIADTPTEPSTVEPPSILTKAFDLLHAFNHKDRVLTLSELARAAQLPKSTVHRLLARLIELDAVEHHGAGYKLSSGSCSWERPLRPPACATLRSPTWPACTAGPARPCISVSCGSSTWSTSRSSRAPTHRLCCPGRWPVAANCTAIGKALLAWEDLDDLAAFLPSPMPKLTHGSVSNVDNLIAELHEVKGHGLARERNEAQPGLSCVAAPVVVRGIAVAAVSVGYRSDTTLNPRVDTALRDTARQIAREVGDSLGTSYQADWRRR